MGEARRLPYKGGKTPTYWPELSIVERHRKLREVWARIAGALDRRIAGVRAAQPLPAPDVRGWPLKAFEDKLDAIVAPPSPPLRSTARPSRMARRKGRSGFRRWGRDVIFDEGRIAAGARNVNNLTVESAF